MKKGAAILGAILLALGLCMSWTGHMMGGATQATVHLFGRRWEVNVPTAASLAGMHITTSSRDVVACYEKSSPGETAPTHAFGNVTVDLDIGDVTIAVGDGDDYLVDVNYWGSGYKVFWDSNNGELFLWSESQSLVGANNCGSSVTIYVPAGTQLDCVSADIDLGSLTLAGLTVETLYANLNLGDLIGENLTVYGSLNADVDLGNVTLYGDLGQSVQIDADLGSVTLGLSRPASDYCWDLDAALGSITVDGRHRSDGISSYVNGGDGDLVIYVRASLGSIDVSFVSSQATQAVIFEGEQEAVSSWTFQGATSKPSKTEPMTVPEPPSVPAAPNPPSAPDPPAVPGTAQSGE